jgi:hypothetical protein
MHCGYTKLQLILQKSAQQLNELNEELLQYFANLLIADIFQSKIISKCSKCSGTPIRRARLRQNAG